MCRNDELNSGSRPLFHNSQPTIGNLVGNVTVAASRLVSNLTTAAGEGGG